MKILVIGLGEHGKDFLCEILYKEYGVSFTSSSKYMNDNHIYDKLKEKYNYKTKEECFEDRRNRREEWYNIIQEYNSKDKSRLAKSVLKENDIYCGMRSYEQFKGSKHLFDLVVWVDATERLGKTESTGSMDIPKGEADIILDNNGTKEEFEEKVKRVFSLLFSNVPVEDRREEFSKKVWAYHFKNKKYPKQIIEPFITYWNRSEGNKLKHEVPEKFHIGRRLSTFSKNSTIIDTQKRINNFKKYLGKINPEL